MSEQVSDVCYSEKVQAVTAYCQTFS